MTDLVFELAESAVSLQKAFFSFALSLAASAIAALVFGRIRESLKAAVFAGIVLEIILILLFFQVRDYVKEYRLKLITETLSSIPVDVETCDRKIKFISNYRDGLELIKLCPIEVGYYIKTADILEQDRDYESAATLIELGLDILPPYETLPMSLCERLLRYYEHLPNRTPLDSDCTKYHVFEIK